MARPGAGRSVDEIPHSHRQYARQRDFQPRCSLSIFTSDEIDYLVRWGHWMQALAEGLIEPVTDAQRRFVEVASDRAESSTAPESLWWRYQERRRLEEADDTLVRGRPEHEWTDPGEDWFRRDEHGKTGPYRRR